ncbi:MAG: hypothetical protein AB1468_00855 [Candidatus Micrarchaeota archaeon]
MGNNGNNTQAVMLGTYFAAALTPMERKDLLEKGMRALGKKVAEKNTAPNVGENKGKITPTKIRR